MLVPSTHVPHIACMHSASRLSPHTLPYPHSPPNNPTPPITVAAGEWLPRLLPQGDPEHDRLWGLIADTFMLCPAWHALSALLG